MDRRVCEKLWTDARRLEMAHHFPVFSLPRKAIPEDFLHRDSRPLHADDLRKANDLAATVIEPSDLHHDVDGRGYLGARGSWRYLNPAHPDHLFQAGE